MSSSPDTTPARPSRIVEKQASTSVLPDHQLHPPVLRTRKLHFQPVIRETAARIYRPIERIGERKCPRAAALFLKKRLDRRQLRFIEPFVMDRPTPKWRTIPCKPLLAPIEKTNHLRREISPPVRRILRNHPGF